MSLSLEELRARAIALPGDVMLCPSCREPILLFRGACFADAELLPGGEKRPGKALGRFKLHCSLCGESVIQQATLAASEAIEDSVGPRILVRSGSWTGWRALGGE